MRRSTLLAYLFTLIGSIYGLRLTEVRIDKHTVRGNMSRLECKFDLQGESLYSVKWYKDGHEFYRYLPRDSPPGQVFPLNGVRVIQDESNESQVTIGPLELSSSGRYRCEVSAEAPSFQTVSDHGDMLTVDGVNRGLHQKTVHEVPLPVADS
ncbi:uncharacterized protein [Halyomorpha halys]|uniref:uncharacterized protein n=1 Tax=Halyomorpha halys TaxID=286706 RepID=UPI0034D2D25E